MNILSLDLSSRIGSLSWQVDGVVRHELEWPVAGRGSRPVFRDLRRAIQAGAVCLDGVQAYAVGTGPGSFSGLRAAVAFMQALAQPGGTPVVAVSSARALAMSIMDESGAERVAVIGDARRQEWWVGTFRRHHGVAVPCHDWILCGDRSAVAREAGTVWVTPDWETLGPALKSECPAGVRLVEEARIPHAGMVARLATVLRSRGEAGEPPVPVYLHPAVSIAPRYQ